MEPALLLNDDYRFKITETERKLWLAGMTTAKKIKVSRSITIKHWLQTLLDVIYRECLSARINNAKPRTLEMWEKAAEDVKRLLS